MANTGELWLQWFSCCVAPPQSRHKRQVQRIRIDRSAIGPPMNFQHTGHIGSGDELLGGAHLNAIQSQMQSKGGYETAMAVKAC